MSRRVSILVLGPISSKWNKIWNKFELWLDNFTSFFIPAGKRSKMKKNKHIVLELFILFYKPQRLGVNWKMLGLRTIFSTKLCQDLSKHRTNETCREGRWTGDREDVLPWDYRVFLTGDRQTKCLDGDRQRTVWCLEQHELHYLRNGRTESVLTVSWRRRGELGCRSNSLSFCVVYIQPHMYPRSSPTSDVYSVWWVCPMKNWKLNLRNLHTSVIP